MTDRKTTPRVRGIALALACAGLLGGCATTTSSTGRTQYVGAVSAQQLDKLGAEAFDELKGQKRQTTDARQAAYVRCVVDAIARQAPGAGAWESAVFVDDSPNAFALPGGKVGVYTRIFKAARNQDQLAAVIGHEIGHVLERHHDERVTRQLGAAGVLQVLGAVAGARYGETGTDIATRGGGILAQGGFLLPGTRQQESEADIVGQRLMAQAGFDPRQAVELWQNMLAADGGNRAPEWLSTHPDPRSRIGELRSRADALAPAYEQARAAGRAPRCG